jgi:hypothetical protein
MAYIYILLILLNTSSAFAIYFNKKIEETLFLSIATKILILFLSGVLFNLAIGFYIIIILNIIMLIYNIYSIAKNNKLIKDNILTIGFYLLIISTLLFIWIDKGRASAIWDEFSHWALVVKDMFSLNNFGLGSDSNVIFKTYLTGTGLFQYLCLKLSGVYNESVMYFSFNMIILSLILPILKGFKKMKSIALFLAYFIIIIIPTMFYPSIYSSLYVDGILGITFGYTLYSYYLNYNEKFNVFNFINLLLSFSMLIFIKDFGLVLALIAFCIILFDKLFIRNKFRLKWNEIYNRSIHLVLAFIPALVIKIVWTMLLSFNKISLPMDGNSFLANTKDLLMQRLSGYKAGVAYDYIRALFYTPLTNSSIGITYAMSIGIFIILTYLLVSNMKKDKLRQSYITLSTLVIVGAIGYALLILISAYLTIFTQYEAVRLASFERYLSTYSVGMLILIFALLIDKYKDDINKLMRFLILTFGGLLLFANFTAFLNITIFARADASNTNNIRSAYKEFKVVTDKYMSKKDVLYFISTDDTGIDFFIARYELTPKKMNLAYGWSIGDKYNDKDIWTVPKTKEEWAKELLDNYDYVYLFDIDNPFINKYKDLFNISYDKINDNQLYKVNKKVGYTKFLELIK